MIERIGFPEICSTGFLFQQYFGGILSHFTSTCPPNFSSDPSELVPKIARAFRLRHQRSSRSQSTQLCIIPRSLNRGTEGSQGSENLRRCRFFNGIHSEKMRCFLIFCVQVVPFSLPLLSEDQKNLPEVFVKN